MEEEEREAYKVEVSEMKIKELRTLLRNQRGLPLDKLAIVLTEFKRRIPYCEICGEKAPVFVLTNIQDSDGTKYQKRQCPKCTKALAEFDGDDYQCLWDE